MLSLFCCCCCCHCVCLCSYYCCCLLLLSSSLLLSMLLLSLSLFSILADWVVGDNQPSYWFPHRKLWPPFARGLALLSEKFGCDRRVPSEKCVCVCVWVREREREQMKQAIHHKWDDGWDRVFTPPPFSLSHTHARQFFCVCVCVCVLKWESVYTCVCVFFFIAKDLFYLCTNNDDEKSPLLLLLFLFAMLTKMNCINESRSSVGGRRVDVLIQSCRP